MQEGLADTHTQYYLNSREIFLFQGDSEFSDIVTFVLQMGWELPLVWSS